MDFERAREIFNSNERFRVLHNGVPVWIDQLDAENNLATVKPLDGRFSASRVPVNELEEG